MLRIFDWMLRMFGKKQKTQFRVDLRDRAKQVEITRKYGSLNWAQRDPKTRYDIDADKVNPNVYIATRAIDDAVKSLPVHIVEIQRVGGVEREVEDIDHPANEIIRTPNMEHSWSDIVSYIVKAFLNDGNAILTVEANTGPYAGIEIWPRDPRTVEISTNRNIYKFGAHTVAERTYPRNRIVHVRDMSAGDPFWGIGRVNTVREEIMMDWYIARFNSGFFRNGATINLMFTPDHDLTEDQHQQILDAMNADVDNQENAFRIFINRYGGKFEHPDQKHKDIAFKTLLSAIRERIFGVYGLPPFRGGVMEYANYANAAAQDKDFWLNTVKPILKVIEDAINKQLLWPFFGPDICLKFDLSSVPALKGDTNEQVERLVKLKKEGIVSAAYVREQLNISEDAAPEEINAPPVNKEVQPTEEEEKNVENALYATMRQYCELTVDKVQTLTAHGRCMSVLCDPEHQAHKVFDVLGLNRALRQNVMPVMQQIIVERGVTKFNAVGRIFDGKHAAFQGVMQATQITLESIVDQMLVQTQLLLENADKYHWHLPRLIREIRSLFAAVHTQDNVHLILPSFIVATMDGITNCLTNNIETMIHTK